jgi:hypothetical protein
MVAVAVLRLLCIGLAEVAKPVVGLFGILGRWSLLGRRFGGMRRVFATGRLLEIALKLKVAELAAGVGQQAELLVAKQVATELVAAEQAANAVATGQTVNAVATGPASVAITELTVHAKKA